MSIITATAALSFSGMACSLSFGAPCQLRSLAGQEHGRTIPLSDVGEPFPSITHPRATRTTLTTSSRWSGIVSPKAQALISGHCFQRFYPLSPCFLIKHRSPYLTASIP